MISYSFCIFWLMFGGISPAGTDLFSLVASLHVSDWRRVEPATLTALTNLPVSSEEVDYPAEYRNDRLCAPMLYSRTHSEAFHVTFEFAASRERGNCVRSLDGISIEANLLPSDAAIAEGRLLRVLKPGGQALSRVGGVEYVWRSMDSRTKYELYISSFSVDRLAKQPFKAILKHMSVDPSDVDDLPFEKGFMPTCGR